MEPANAARAAPALGGGDPRKFEHFGERLGQENNSQSDSTQFLASADDWRAGYLSAHATRFRPVIYGDALVPGGAFPGLADAPKLLGKTARHSLKIATIQRAHAQKALAFRLPYLTPGDTWCALVEMKRHGLQFDAGYYAGETDTQPVPWGEPNASNLLCRGKNAPFRSLKDVPRAYLIAALEAADTRVKPAPLDRARFGRITGLTQAERVACGAYQIRPCDMSMAAARRDTYRRSQRKRRAALTPEEREAENKHNAERMAAKRQAKRELLVAATLALWSLWLRRFESLCVNSLLIETNSRLLTHTQVGGDA